MRFYTKSLIVISLPLALAACGSSKTSDSRAPDPAPATPDPAPTTPDPTAASANTPATPVSSDAQQGSTSSAKAAKLTTAAANLTVAADTCTPIEISSKDNTQVLATLTAPATISWSGAASTAGIYSDATCTSNATSLVIPQGSYSVTVYFKDTNLPTGILTFADTSSNSLSSVSLTLNSPASDVSTNTTSSSTPSQGATPSSTASSGT